MPIEEVIIKELVQRASPLGLINTLWKGFTKRCWSFHGFSLTYVANSISNSDECIYSHVLLCPSLTLLLSHTHPLTAFTCSCHLFTINQPLFCSFTPLTPYQIVLLSCLTFQLLFPDCLPVFDPTCFWTLLYISAPVNPPALCHRPRVLPDCSLFLICLCLVGTLSCRLYLKVWIHTRPLIWAICL